MFYILILYKYQNRGKRFGRAALSNMATTVTETERYLTLFPIGDNALTSSVMIAQVFPKFFGKTTHATLKVYRGMLKYMIGVLFV